MKPSGNSWFMTLNIKTHVNLPAMVYTRKFIGMWRGGKSQSNSMKMISKQGPRNNWPWWICNGERSALHGDMALVFSHHKIVRHRQSMKFPTRPSKYRRPLPCSYVRSENPPKSPITLCLTGSFWLENLVILTLKSAHAWQNVDRMPQGIGSKQDFAL